MNFVEVESFQDSDGEEVSIGWNNHGAALIGHTEDSQSRKEQLREEGQYVTEQELRKIVCHLLSDPRENRQLEDTVSISDIDEDVKIIHLNRNEGLQIFLRRKGTEPVYFVLPTGLIYELTESIVQNSNPF